MMKRFLAIVCLIALGSSVLAQNIDRSKKPAAGAAPAIQLKDSRSFILPNGLKVFVVENNKLPKINLSLVLDIDPVMEGDAVGYESLSGSMIGTATKTKSKEQLDAAIDLLGANFSANSEGFFASSLSKHKEALLAIVSDIILNAEFKQSELDKLKKQTISGLQTEKDDANAIAENVRRALVYGPNHPYGQITTEASVEKVTLPLVENHFRTYYRPNVGYLAIVGDIKYEEAKTLIEKYFGAWERKDVPKHTYATPAASKGRRVIVVNKTGAVQTVINISHPLVLTPGSPDAIAASTLNNMLGGADARLFNNLREAHGYTYGAYSDLSTDKLVGSFNAYAQVRTAVTDSAVTEFIYELDRIRNEDAPADEVQGILNYMTGSFARSLERPQTVANFAINVERYGLSKDYYKNYLQSLNAITPSDIRRVAGKYIMPDNAIVVCVGSKDEIASKLAVFASSGKVEYYDNYGREVKAVSTPVPAGVTAESVVRNYITAVGGEKNWSKIRDLKIVMGATVQNMALEQVIQKKTPGKYMTEVKINGSMTVQKIVFDGTKGQQSGMQGSKALEGEILADTKESAAMLTELAYLSKPYSLQLKGIERIGETEAYQVEVTNAAGKKSTHFFDTKSGLKVREVSTTEGPEGPASQTFDLADYKEIKGGVKIPHKMSIDFGVQVVEMTLKSAETNSKIKDSEFEVK